MVTALREKENSIWKFVQSPGDSYYIKITEKSPSVKLTLVNNSHRQHLMLSVGNSRHGHTFYAKLEYKCCITVMFANVITSTQEQKVIFVEVHNTKLRKQHY
jgi:heme exporter protein D